VVVPHHQRVNVVVLFQVTHSVCRLCAGFIPVLLLRTPDCPFIGLTNEPENS
jgi:hypothetical protein